MQDSSGQIQVSVVVFSIALQEAKALAGGVKEVRRRPGMLKKSEGGER